MTLLHVSLGNLVDDLAHSRAVLDQAEKMVKELGRDLKSVLLGYLKVVVLKVVVISHIFRWLPRRVAYPALRALGKTLPTQR